MAAVNIFTNTNLFDKLANYLSYGFVRNALIVAVLVSICSALIGVVLVLKRFSPLGDGLSHIAFGAVALATSIGIWDIGIAIPATIIAAILILCKQQNRKIMGDATIAMLSVGALAIGYTAISLGGATNLGGDVCTALFGSSEILSTSTGEIILVLGITLVLILLAAVFYYQIFAVTFDESYRRATGGKTELYNVIFATVTAIVVVLGMKLAGALLISSLIVFPPMTAMRLSKSFRGVIVLSGVISAVCGALGTLLSILIDTPIGATVAAVDIIVFFFAFIFSKK